MYVSAITMWAYSYVLPAYCHLTAGITIPDGDTMSPPQLARDTPIMDMFQPIHVYFVETFRYDFHETVFDCPHGWSSKRPHLDEPLFRNEWFNNCIAALAVTQRHHIVF